MRRIFYFLLFLVGLWLLAFVWFYAQIPTPEVQRHFDEHTDAIVVLTGGKGRFNHGLELLVEGRAQEMLVSGVDKDVKPHELVEMYGIEANHPALASGNSRITLDHGPNNTVGNARSTAIWAREKGFRNLYLVTSSYHMPRSLMEFRHAMPEVTIVPEPVFPEWEGEETALFSRGPIRLLLLEFHKYLARVLYYALPQSLQRLDENLPAAPDISLMTLGASPTPAPIQKELP